MLPEGDYRIRVDSTPAYEVDVRLVRNEGVTLMLEKAEGVVSHSEQRHLVEYIPCEDTNTTLVEHALPDESVPQRAASSYFD